MISLGIVLPCFNEAAQIEKTITELDKQIEVLINKKKINNTIICIIDDGSIDDTWSIISNLKRNFDQFTNKKIIGLKFSKNFGHQYALLAGINRINDKVDCILTVDSDLEQDVSILPNFIEEFEKGNEIVLGIRKNTQSVTGFKSLTSKMFYKIANLLKLNLESDHADYRLISSRVAKEVSMHNEYYIFLRGLITNIGFKTSKVYYDENLKINRKSRYTKIKMFELAIDGVTSYSIVPLRLLSALGFLTVIFSLIMIFYVFYVKLFLNTKAPGWASTV